LKQELLSDGPGFTVNIAPGASFARVRDSAFEFPLEEPQRSPWVRSTELRRILEEAPADPALLEDLADARGTEVDDEKAGPSPLT
jgi:hypothetical protein